MNRMVSIAGLLLLGWAGAAAAQSASEIPMRDFFRNPDRVTARRCRSCSRGSGG